MQEISERLTFTLEAEIGGGDGGAIPDVVQLLPSGKVVPKGKTDFLVDSEARRLIVAAFDSSKTDLVIDYEHQSLTGSEAPAAGWIKGLDDRGDGGLWAKVQWTDKAMEYLKKKEYRYLSPVVLVRKKDGRAVQLLGAALTNLPAIDGMEPVAGASRPSAEEEVRRLDDKYREFYLHALKLAGLPEDADMEEARSAFAALLRPDGFVPASEYEALKGQLKAREAEAVIAQALSDGRLTPALLPWARGYAMSDPAGFREFIGKTGPLVPLGARAVPAGPRVDQAQRAVNRLLGINDETFLRYGRQDASGDCGGL